jgi:AbiTii
VSLLTEIQDSAVEAKDIEVALRKAKILASRLNNVDFKKWVDFELNGYPDSASLPGYRIIPAVAKGYFSGFAGSSIDNAPIPAACLPEKFRDFARRVYIQQGIGTIEATIATGKNETLSFPWPGDLLALVGRKIYQNMSCLSAWLELPTTAFVGIVEAVRSKLIDFVLEIERENPDAGETKGGSLPPERVAQIFHQVFNVSGNANIASGSAHFSQYISVEIREGNLTDLRKYLKSVGVDDGDQKELIEALKSDPRPESRDHLGPRVSKWLGKMATKAASGAWSVSLAAASELLTRAIGSYYGLK